MPTLEVFAAVNGGALSTRARKLTRAEIALARPIFGDSIFYDAVRIVVGSIANAPTTLGNFVRISPRHEADGLPNATLLHELTHIWQFQTRGTGYVSNSLCAQVAAMVSSGDRNDAYDVTGPELELAASIYQLSAEKQAMLVQYWFMDNSIAYPVRDAHGQPAKSWMKVREIPVCHSMLEELRVARPLSMSQILDEAAFGPGGANRRAVPRDDETVPLLRFEF